MRISVDGASQDLQALEIGVCNYWLDQSEIRLVFLRLHKGSWEAAGLFPGLHSPGSAEHRLYHIFVSHRLAPTKKHGRGTYHWRAVDAGFATDAETEVIGVTPQDLTGTQAQVNVVNFGRIPPMRRNLAGALIVQLPHHRAMDNPIHLRNVILRS